MSKLLRRSIKVTFVNDDLSKSLLLDKDPDFSQSGLLPCDFNTSTVHENLVWQGYSIIIDSTSLLTEVVGRGTALTKLFACESI